MTLERRPDAKPTGGDCPDCRRPMEARVHGWTEDHYYIGHLQKMSAKERKEQIRTDPAFRFKWEKYCWVCLKCGTRYSLQGANEEKLHAERRPSFDFPLAMT